MVDECFGHSTYYKNVPAQCLKVLSLTLTKELILSTVWVPFLQAPTLNIMIFPTGQHHRQDLGCAFRRILAGFQWKLTNSHRQEKM